MGKTHSSQFHVSKSETNFILVIWDCKSTRYVGLFEKVTRMILFGVERFCQYTCNCFINFIRNFMRKMGFLLNISYQQFPTFGKVEKT